MSLARELWPLAAGALGAAAIVLLREQPAGGEPAGFGYETTPGEVGFPFETEPGSLGFLPFVPAPLTRPDNPYPPGTNCAAVYEACRRAGFTNDGARILTAIAQAESGCGAGATCASCAGVTEYSVGAFQINLLAHPSVSEACARDLDCAARAAYLISGGGTNFQPWSTYTSGRYRSFLQ